MITDDDLDKLADEFKEWRIADQMNCNSCPESKLALKEDGSAETVMDPDSETCKECMDDMRTTGAHINAGMLAAYFDDAMYCIGRIATTELIDETSHDVINLELEEMIKKLNDMKQNMMCTVMMSAKVKE